ncbi:hypothetical protein [Acrocarpospora pleiomorpha]|uniref:hypothetical protein n=1 Tax=Acrocarpospora pleiomorpha TaxID=90975 RepID=UPI0012D358E8
MCYETWPAVDETRCPDCGWITADGNDPDSEQLDRARHLRDLRAAIRVARKSGWPTPADLKSFRRLLRGTLSTESDEERKELDAAHAEADRAQQMDWRASVRGSDALAEGFTLFTDTASSLRHHLFIVRLTRDDMAAQEYVLNPGTGRPEPAGDETRIPWRVFIPGLSSSSQIRQFQLAGGVGVRPPHLFVDGIGSPALAKALPGAVPWDPNSGLWTQPVVINFVPGWPLIDRIAGCLERELAATIFTVPPQGVSEQEVITEILARIPLVTSYYLLLAEINLATSELTRREEPLFEKGTVAGLQDEVTVTVTIPGVAKGGVYLPVMTRPEPPEEGLDPEPCTVGGIVLTTSKPNVPIRVTAKLEGAGHVSLTPSAPGRGSSGPDEVPAAAELAERWQAWRDHTDSIDVKFLIELSAADWKTFKARWDLVGKLMRAARTTLIGEEKRLRLQVVGYGHHDTQPELVDANLFTRSAARGVNWSEPTKDPVSTGLEHAFRYVAENTTWEAPTKRFLVTVGSRVPCVTDQLSEHAAYADRCPDNLNWRDELAKIKADNVTCLAVTFPRELPLHEFQEKFQRRHDDHIWQQIGSGGVFPTPDSDISNKLLTALGIHLDAPFPFAVFSPTEPGVNGVSKRRTA